MQDPLKQGLKLYRYIFKFFEVFIRMQDPLKQGLKPDQNGNEIMTSGWIRMQDPLKQGLKHHIYMTVFSN